MLQASKLVIWRGGVVVVVGVCRRGGGGGVSLSLWRRGCCRVAVAVVGGAPRCDLFAAGSTLTK